LFKRVKSLYRFFIKEHLHWQSFNKTIIWSSYWQLADICYCYVDIGVGMRLELCAERNGFRTLAK